MTQMLFGIASFAFAVFASVASAEPVKVGAAEAVRNQVSSVDGAVVIPLSVGDDIVQDEVLQTRANSDAKIVLLDDTKLSLGPNSTLKIDNAVYSTDTSYRAVGIKLTEGAFRFITGKSDKNAYKIETPTATIGVRGTILDIRIQKNQTLVTLQDGQAGVCAGSQCVQLLERGNTANVALRVGGAKIKLDLKPSWTFASICSGNAALCAPLPPLVQRAAIPSVPGGASMGDALKAATGGGTLAKPLRDIASSPQRGLSSPNIVPDNSAIDPGRLGLPNALPSLPSTPSLPSAPNIGGGLLRR